MNPAQVLGLALVFATFCVLMGLVLRFCQVERRRALAGEGGGSDQRIAWLLLAVIAVGAVLAVITAQLVFFKAWG